METLIIYGIEQIDLLTMRLRVKRGAMNHDECMRTLKESYKLSKAYHATI